MGKRDKMRGTCACKTWAVDSSFLVRPLKFVIFLQHLFWMCCGHWCPPPRNSSKLVLPFTHQCVPFLRVFFFCLHSFPNTLIPSHNVIKLCFSSWHGGHQQAVKYKTALLHLICCPLGAVHQEIINTAQVLKLTGGKKRKNVPHQ